MQRITRGISIGRFPPPARQLELLDAGVTHLLNVSETLSVDGHLSRFRGHAWHELPDDRLLPVEPLISALNDLHAFLTTDAHVYVHCMAAWHRSPTVVWFYLLACGWSRGDAASVITTSAPDATPGVKKLVDESLIESVLARTAGFLPHPAPRLLDPA